MRTPCQVLWLALLLAATCAASADDREVEYLLDYVADSGCIFTRNGEAHEAVDAAEHLRMKYERAGRHAPTAETFIDRLASESSWTGKAYTVTCDGETRTSNRWLHRALADYRSGEPAP